MQEPPDRAATGSPNNGSGAAEFAELRRILVGQDLDEIASLQKRLDDPAVRSGETGKVLPAAIKSAHGKSLREALEPVFEKSFKLRSASGHFRRDLPRDRPGHPNLHRRRHRGIRRVPESDCRKSAWRAIRWRIEARLTGRPFTEILLTRSLLYSVEQVFLIHRESGLLLMHVAAQSAVVKDADMVSGMLTAILDFVSDSFAEGGQRLETPMSAAMLWMRSTDRARWRAVGGTAPVELKGVFQSALDQIHEELFAPLDAFKQDDLSVFEPARPYLEKCLLGQKAPDKRSHFALWLMLAGVVALLAGLVFLQLRNQRRWDEYVAALRRQPWHRRHPRREARIGRADRCAQGRGCSRAIGSPGGLRSGPVASGLQMGAVPVAEHTVCGRARIEEGYGTHRGANHPFRAGQRETAVGRGRPL